MKSSGSSELLDLERGVPVSQEDVTALRRARALAQRMTSAGYLAFLQSFPPATYGQLRMRPHPRGEPFSLPPANEPSARRGRYGTVEDLDRNPFPHARVSEIRSRLRGRSAYAVGLSAKRFKMRVADPGPVAANDVPERPGHSMEQEGRTISPISRLRELALFNLKVNRS